MSAEEAYFLAAALAFGDLVAGFALADLAGLAVFLAVVFIVVMWLSWKRFWDGSCDVVDVLLSHRR